NRSHAVRCAGGQGVVYSPPLTLKLIGFFLFDSPFLSVAHSLFSAPQPALAKSQSVALVPRFARTVFELLGLRQCSLIIASSNASMRSCCSFTIGIKSVHNRSYISPAICPSSSYSKNCFSPASSTSSATSPGTLLSPSVLFPFSS